MTNENGKPVNRTVGVESDELLGKIRTLANEKGSSMSRIAEALMLGAIATVEKKRGAAIPVTPHEPRRKNKVQITVDDL